MKYEIKELEIGGILDQAIRLFRNNLKFLAVLGCIPLIPGLALALIAAAIAPAAMSNPFMGPQVSFGDMNYIILILVSLLVLTITNAFCSGSVAWGIAHRYLGNDVPAGACLRIALRRAGTLGLASILYGLGVGIGSMLCTIPGIYLMLAWYIVYPALMFENLSAVGGLGRSRKLMVGHKGKALVLGFILLVIVVAANAFGILIPNAYAAATLSECVRVAALVFNSVAVTVLYFSARCRVEQFDLELMTQAIEGKAQTEGPVL